MKKEGELKINGGSVIYLIEGNKTEIKACRAETGYMEIPESIEGFPVVSVGKKAALGSKSLTELSLPDTIEEIGDWAFAHCGKLTGITLPKKTLRFGKGCFKDCGSLTDIRIREEGGFCEQAAKLLGAVPMQLQSEYLLNPLEAGSEIWLAMYDARLLTLLNRPDREGYSRQVLCGEEDLMANLETYMTEVRREKAELCYLRLINDMGLKEDFKELLKGFLKENTKGCEYEAAWQVLLEQYGTSRQHYTVFAEAGCITEENFDGLLSDMGDKNPEMKAFLLRYKEEHRKAADFFDSLSLDWQ